MDYAVLLEPTLLLKVSFNLKSWPSPELLEAVKNVKPKSLEEVQEFELLRRMFKESIELSYYLFNTDDPLTALQKHLSSLDRLVGGIKALIDRHSLTDPMYTLLIEEVTQLKNNTESRIKELQEKFND